MWNTRELFNSQPQPSGVGRYFIVFILHMNRLTLESLCDSFQPHSWQGTKPGCGARPAFYFTGLWEK